MAKRMGVKEFREKFTTIAREATEPVIVTNHDRIVGRYTPARREPPSAEWMAQWRKQLDETRLKLRADLEARGVDVKKRLAELGIEDDEAFEDPWFQGKGEPPRRDEAESED